jgi:hypothetical protein
MRSEVKRIAYEEFANNLSSVLDRVVHENAVVVVETADGELALLRYLAPEELPTKREADYAAFRSAAGSWAEVDTDLILKRVYESRDQPGRPPVRL